MKFLFILLALPFALKSEEQKFNYASIGGYAGFATNLASVYGYSPGPGIDCAIGHRHVWGKHGWDINGGGTWMKGLSFPWPYIQSSYLYYPTNNFYAGAGLTLIPMPVIWTSKIVPLPNFPLTIGYQIKDKPQFVQLQYGVINRSVTFSYGVGF